MTVKHWNTGVSAERYRDQADKPLQNIIADLRDLRDESYCAYSEWQEKGEPEKDEKGNIISKYDVECTCYKFDEIIDKLLELKPNKQKEKND
jgi:hypothetical protein|tara:strand:+ start:226 stop:501 length:276 start_codon:yes stop_codon:yes gene_type:complete